MLPAIDADQLSSHRLRLQQIPQRGGDIRGVGAPVQHRAGALAVGDRVLLRHAKAGEMCERLAEVARVDADGTARVVPTYRGEGRVFG